MEIKVGDVFKTQNSNDVVVIEYINSDKILVEFLDKYKHRAYTQKGQLIKGWIKNPYFPKIFGVGYFGVGGFMAKYGSSSKGVKNTPEYSAWTNMLSRCYDSNYIGRKTYDGVSVEDKWFNFQVFAEWYSHKYSLARWEGAKHLDKDLLGSGYKYSSEECCLLPSELNNAIKTPRTNKNGLQMGKLSDGTTLYRHYLNRDRAFYSTNHSKAVEYYVSYKKEKILMLADKYEPFLDPKVIARLSEDSFYDRFVFVK